MTRDEPDHALRATLGAHEIRSTSRVVQIERERAVAAREPEAERWREGLKQHAGDAVPQSGVVRLRTVVQHSGQDKLVVGAERTKDVRGALGMALVPPRHREVPPRLHHAADRAQRNPVRKKVSDVAGTNTSERRTCGAASKISRRRNGPYC